MQMMRQMIIETMFHLSGQIRKNLSEGSANALDHHVLAKHLVRQDHYDTFDNGSVEDDDLSKYDVDDDHDEDDDGGDDVGEDDHDEGEDLIEDGR